MSEEYEEEYDRTKVFALIIGLVSVVVLIIFLATVDFDQIIPEIQLDETIFETESQIPDQLEPGKGVIKDEYFQYLDFGLSIDDIVDIQSIDCNVFHNQNNSLSTDSKYENIFNQRKNECGL